MKKPNLLFVLVDQMRYHAMGCAGNTQIHTPNLDQMAGDGAMFRNAVSNTPVCTPARACLLTGLYPLSHTVLTNNSMLPKDMPSIGKMLKSQGYSTGYIGKWHLAGEAFIGATEQNQGHVGYIPPGEMRHGFDYWAVHHCSHDYQNGFYYRDTPEPIYFNQWEPDGQTDLALDFIQDHVRKNTEDPFALFVSWGGPHTPFVAPDEFRAMYDAKKLQLRPNVRIHNGFMNGNIHCGSPIQGFDTPEDLVRDFTANYYASISNLDYNMGRLLNAMDENGLQDDTIVVFTSDHGEMLGSHGQMHKLQIWDESVLVPFLIRYPKKITKGMIFDTPLGSPDILPTLFGLMDLPVPSHVEGVDCSPALTGQPFDEPTSAFLIWPCNALTWGKRWTNCAGKTNGFPIGYMREYRGIRTKTHTYVIHRDGPWYLYENQNDPYQENNLVEAGLTVPPELESELQHWLEKTGDMFEDTDYYIDCIDLETGLATKPEKFKGTAWRLPR